MLSIIILFYYSPGMTTN